MKKETESLQPRPSAATRRLIYSIIVVHKKAAANVRRLALRKARHSTAHTVLLATELTAPNHTELRQAKYMIAAQSTLISAWMFVHVKEKPKPDSHRHIDIVRLTRRHCTHIRAQPAAYWSRY